MTKLTMNTSGGRPPREAAFVPVPHVRAGVPKWIIGCLAALFLAMFTGLVVTTTLLVVQANRTEPDRMTVATQLDEPTYSAAENDVTRTDVSLLQTDHVDETTATPTAATVPAPIAEAPLAAEPAQATVRPDRFHRYRVPSCVDYLDTLVKITTVRFGVGSDDPVPTDMIRARNIATAVEFCDEVKVIVEGHSDRRGNDQLNMNLSWFRAQSVIDQLQREGFDISAMQPRGFGATRPINLSGTISGEAENRRVQFTLAPRAAPPVVTASGN